MLMMTLTTHLSDGYTGREREVLDQSALAGVLCYCSSSLPASPVRQNLFGVGKSMNANVLFFTSVFGSNFVVRFGFIISLQRE